MSPYSDTPHPRTLQWEDETRELERVVHHRVLTTGAAAQISDRAQAPITHEAVARLAVCTGWKRRDRQPYDHDARVRAWVYPLRNL